MWPARLLYPLDSQQEYWSGLPFPSPGDLPNPGMEPMSAAWSGRFFTTELPGKPFVKDMIYPWNYFNNRNLLSSVPEQSCERGSL